MDNLELLIMDYLEVQVVVVLDMEPQILLEEQQYLDRDTLEEEV